MKAFLEDKITIKSIGVWRYLSHKIYAKNNYVFCVKISATTKITVLNQTYAAGRASNIELSMLVLDFMVKCRQKNTQWNFCGIHGIF